MTRAEWKPGNHPFIEEKHRRKHRDFESERFIFSVDDSGGVFGKTPGLFGLLRQADLRIRLAVGRSDAKVPGFEPLRTTGFEPRGLATLERIFWVFL